MPQTIDLINFPCGEDVTQWPKLTCTQPGHLDLQDASLRLPGSRDIVFQDNGQLRSFDDTHRLVFDRVGGLLELHEAGAIRFLTGSPTPTEKMRILATGQVGIGTATPTSLLHVTGDMHTDGALRVAGHAAVGGTLTVESSVGIGTATPTQTLEVVGTVKATGFQGSGAGLTEVSGTDNTKVAKTGDTMSGELVISAPGTGLRVTDNAAVGGTLTVSNNIGIGTMSPAELLEVNGRIKAGALTIGPWPANPNGYIFFGTNALNQADAGNYALLQEAAGSRGVTFLNSPASIQFRIRNADKMVLANNGQLQILADSNPIHFTAGWNGFPDVTTNRAEISNDTGTYRTLMIVGNRSAGIGRRVSIWDRLEVNGSLLVQSGPLIVQQTHTLKLGVPTRRYGNDGIRGEPNLFLDAAGTVLIKRGFVSDGMDVAERFKTAEQVHAGQVVIFDEPAEAVRLCDRAYDSRVVGIASAEPAFILGLDPKQMPIALCGRVPCYVDADIAPIAVGDLLTTSPTRGHAQKVLQSDKALGAIIGKALGRLDAGQGKIPVMVLLQ